NIAAHGQLIDDVYGRAERFARRQLMRGTDGEADLQHLLVVFQVIPELERSGDLVEHIAMRASQRLADVLPPRCRGLVERMGAAGVRMWELAADAFASMNRNAAHRLRELDDELDDLHVQLTAELAQAPIPIPVAIEM